MAAESGAPEGVRLITGDARAVLAAHRLGHPATGIDLNPAYRQITKQRLAEQSRSYPAGRQGDR